jgi:phosphopantothenoylcysteine decarboxylase/phosphopantothenate--cysteine ligase
MRFRHLHYPHYLKNPVYSSFYNDDEKEAEWNNVELGPWADLMVVAPATATLSKKWQEL